MQNGRQKHEVMLAVADLGGQQDQARQHPRCLDDSGAGTAPERILAFQLNRKVQTLIQHARERVCDIEANRRQHRHQFAEEKCLDPFALHLAPSGTPEKADPLFREPRQNFLIQQLVLEHDQRMSLLGNSLEYLMRQHSIRSKARRIQVDLLLQPRDADFEKLIEVTADYTQKSQALKKRNI